MKPCLPVFLVLGLLTAGVVSPAYAQVALPDPTDDILLTVDLSPSVAQPGDFRVAISATGNVSLATDSSNTFFDGVDLANFFTTSEAGTFNGLPSSLSTYLDGTPFYDSIYIDDYSTLNTSQDGLDLNLYSASSSNGNTEDFVGGMKAFLGSMTFDLIPGIAQSNDFIGNIYAGDSYDVESEETTDAIGADDPVIDGLSLLGQYEVFYIPEPSQGSLLVLGAMGLVAAGFCRRSSRA